MPHHAQTLAMLNTYITANLQLEAGDSTIENNRLEVLTVPDKDIEYDCIPSLEESGSMEDEGCSIHDGAILKGVNVISHSWKPLSSREWGHFIHEWGHFIHERQHPPRGCNINSSS